MTDHEREEALRLDEAIRLTEEACGHKMIALTDFETGSLVLKIDQIEKLIRHARQSAPQGEPVGYIYEDDRRHLNDVGRCFIYQEKQKFALLSDPGCRPVYYASPPAQPDVVRALAECVKRLDSTDDDSPRHVPEWVRAALQSASKPQQEAVVCDSPCPACPGVAYPCKDSPPAQAVPEGWQLVPKEVLRQLRHYTDCHLTRFPDCGAPTKNEIDDAWLTAAPKPGGKDAV